MKQNILVWSAIVGVAFSSSWATVFTPLDTDIHEPDGIYYQDPATMLRVDLRTVISEGPCEVGDYSGCTLDDVNNDIDKYDDFKPEIKVHFQADDFPDDGKVSNATLRLRGGASRLEDLKSYRIKLDSKHDLWRGERKLQLNKHLSDLTRIKNKLSFDLMRDIPNLPSLRTQFVHLYIDNQDYGLFTHVENVGKEYLLRRGFHKHSNVYKAYHFDFKIRPELALDENGQPIDQKAFDYILEQKRGKDSKKLLEMLNALNNPNNNFQQDVLAKYFNENNLLTWEAVNILMGNTDVTTSNFYIFNPKGKDTFYFLPWDYDSTWGYDWQPTIVEGGYVPGKCYRGPFNFWATEIGRRYLSQPGNLNKLKLAVEEIKNNYLTPDKIEALTNSYYDLVYPILHQSPDLDYLDSNQPTEELIFQEYNSIYNQLASTVEINYQRFLKDLNSPMPFHMDTPYIEGDEIVFEWEPSVDLQGDDVTYDLEISTSYNFEPNQIKFSVKNLTTNGFRTKWMLPKGDYFFRVIARDSANPQENWQNSFEEYYDKVADHTAYGVDNFHVDFDGTPIDNHIVIDGEMNDWQGKLIFSDADDIATADVVDWRQGGFVQDSNRLYLAYVNDDTIDSDRFWAWHIFIDNKDSVTIGYDGGYDYLLEGANLYRYTGDGESWSWEFIGSVPHAINGSFAEFALDKVSIDNATDFEFLFYGSNSYLDPATPVDIMTSN